MTSLERKTQSYWTDFKINHYKKSGDVSFLLPFACAPKNNPFLTLWDGKTSGFGVTRFGIVYITVNGPSYYTPYGIDSITFKHDINGIERSKNGTFFIHYGKTDPIRTSLGKPDFRTRVYCFSDAWQPLEMIPEKTGRLSSGQYKNVYTWLTTTGPLVVKVFDGRVYVYDRESHYRFVMDNGNPSIRFFGKTYRLLVKIPEPEDSNALVGSDEKCRNLAVSYIMDLGNCRSLAEKQVLENELNEKVKSLYESSYSVSGEVIEHWLEDLENDSSDSGLP